jgi:peptide chain release factor 1
MLDKLKSLEEKYEKVAALMADPAIAGDPSKYREQAKSYLELAPVVTKYREYGRAPKSRPGEDARPRPRTMMRELAQEEALELEQRS